MYASNRCCYFSLVIGLSFLANGFSSHRANSAEPLGPVNQDHLLRAQQNNSNWLMYGPHLRQSPLFESRQDQP